MTPWIVMLSPCCADLTLVSLRSCPQEGIA